MKGHKITHDEKEAALEARRELGTLKAAALIAGVSVRTLNNEMKRSEVFKRRMQEAAEEGHSIMADNAIQLLKDYAEGKYPKNETDRNRLTAAIAIANWVVPGFRGVTTIQGRVDHDIRVISAVPRPEYGEIEAPKVK